MDIGNSKKPGAPLRFDVSAKTSTTPSAEQKANVKNNVLGQQVDVFNGGKSGRTMSPLKASLDQLGWLNPSQKRLALARWQTASKNNVPYAYAVQTIEGRYYYLDAHSAWEEISESDDDGKLYNLENQPWSPSAKKTIFFCAIPDAAEGLRLGTMDSLKATGMSAHHLSLLLTANSMEDEAFGTQHEEDLYLNESKSLYIALLTTGTILQKNLDLAQKIRASADVELLHDATLKLMTYSAGHNMFFLNLGLKMGINPDEKSKEAGCRPITWAIIKGNHAAVQKLLPFTADPGVDRDFLLDLGSGPRDPKLLDWALNYKTRTRTSR